MPPSPMVAPSPEAGEGRASPGDGGPPLFIVLNCGSGKGDADAARTTIGEILTAAGREHHFHVVDQPQRLPEIARRVAALATARGGIVVAAGGDGTINALAQAVLGHDCPVGVLPQGTFNYVGRRWGIPEETAAATHALLAARPVPVQVGLVNGQVFLVNASIGLYPRLLEERESMKRQYGRNRFVALLAAISTLLGGHRQMRLSIEHQGENMAIRTPTLFVGNNRLQLEQIGIPEADAVERGRLVAITPQASGTLHLLWLTLRGLFGRLGQASEVKSFTFEHLTVRRMGRMRRRRIRIARDGELGWLEAPLEFSVSPHRLLLLVPGEPQPADR